MSQVAEQSPRLEPAEIARGLAKASERLHRLIASGRLPGPHVLAEAPDASHLARAFLAAASELASQPQRLWAAQWAAWARYVRLWQRATLALWGVELPPVAEPAPGDRRFTHEAWSQHPLFDFLKQAYLLTAEAVHDLVGDLRTLPEADALKVAFYTRQFVDALSPSNFLLTNPEVLQITLHSGGRNLVDGLNNLLADLERGNGQLRISQTDFEAFDLGRNIATTPGDVVFETELMQLIQFRPSTETVYRRPLVIVPPWINKYYILDLREKNSFIRWAVAQGHTVFVLSWVNPDERLAQKTFEDYLTEGTLAALDAVREATGEQSVNAIGYCLGGTLLASTLAVLAARGEAERVASATFFTTLLDFSIPGEIKVFVDEEQVADLERKMARTGYLEGAKMANAFNMLRANDLIWSFVVNNYLLGREPFPFDLLYWNADSTRMPAAMHSYYLRNMYLENRLVEPGGLTLCGEPVDLGRVTTPAYFLSTAEDHIAPWQGTYLGARRLGGPVRFVLGNSGHIAGVINPPAAGKYGYRTGPEVLPEAPEEWLAASEEHAGSWWPDWARWVARFGLEQVAPRPPGGGRLPVIEPAPGRYARMRADEATAPGCRALEGAVRG